MTLNHNFGCFSGVKKLLFILFLTAFFIDLSNFYRP